MSVTAKRGRHNATVELVQFRTGYLAARGKQTGRRFGPPPKKAPRTTPAKPLTYAARLDNYHTQNGRTYVTDRQYRQLSRKAALHEPTFCTDFRRDAVAKGHATPKRPSRKVA